MGFLLQGMYWIIFVLNYTEVLMCILIVGRLLIGCASVRLQAPAVDWLNLVTASVTFSMCYIKSHLFGNQTIILVI